jgi:hypothetical protein
MAAIFVGDLQGRSRNWVKLATTGVCLGLVIAFAVQLHAVSAFTGQFARKDPTHQLRGWQEIGAALKDVVGKTDAAFVLTSGYGLNGQIDFLMKDTVPVHQFTQRIRYIMAPEPQEAEFDGAGLYVAESRRDQADVLKARFETVEQVAVLERLVKGVPLEELVVYRLSGRKTAALDPLETK